MKERNSEFICIIFFELAMILITACKQPTENRCIETIGNLQKESYNYCIDDSQRGVFVYHAKKQKVTTGSKENGFFYDENEGLQYHNGEIITLSDVELAEYDELASKYLDIIKHIVDNREYDAYEDTRIGLRKKYYYFSISEKGMKRFEEVYSSGRITFVHRKGEIVDIDVRLFIKGEEKPSLSLWFGEVAFEIKKISGG